MANDIPNARYLTVPSESAAYLETVYEEANPGPSWQRKNWPIPANGELVSALDGNWGTVEKAIGDKIKAKGEAKGAEAKGGLSDADVQRATRDSVRALMMIRAYRMRGHLHANLDPLGLEPARDHEELHPATYGFTEADYDRKIFIDHVLGLEVATIPEMLKILRRTYCSTIGFEFMHISDPHEKAWMQERIEGPDKEITFTREGKRAILQKLVEAEGFEKFCDLRFRGTKRFGLDGGEAMVPALEQIIKRGGALGVREIVFGMSHRGRLNVLSTVMHKPTRAIFHEFKGGSYAPDDVEGSGDVKYHLGASSDREFDANKVHLSLTANPSHLEIVDPVVLGKVRAKQDQLGDFVQRTTVLPLLIHGDAAFAGQGVVAECFGLSGIKGHRTGGSIHFIVNNQIGFTTYPRYSRSTPYPSDVAKMIEAPIFHVNGDDPEACVFVTRLALDYRQRFHKDVVIDLVCYRRHGHNEADEPSATQPVMYQIVRKHPTTRQIYADQLVAEQVIEAGEPAAMVASYRDGLDSGKPQARAALGMIGNNYTVDWKPYLEADPDDNPVTGVDLSTLTRLGAKAAEFPAEVVLHPRVQRIYDDRVKMYAGNALLDWGAAEMLSYATLVDQGYEVRITGQDSGRGTFFHRHAVLHDQGSDRVYVPLANLAERQTKFTVTDSVLSEEAVLGFEYGFSTTSPNVLVVWEAQFGDFANGAQVVIDQFISSGEAKWGRICGITLLLPHGYEGQGPEHSSARLERFQQLCA